MDLPYTAQDVIDYIQESGLGQNKSAKTIVVYNRAYLAYVLYYYFNMKDQAISAHFAIARSSITVLRAKLPLYAKNTKFLGHTKKVRDRFPLPEPINIEKVLYEEDNRFFNVTISLSEEELNKLNVLKKTLKTVNAEATVLKIINESYKRILGI